MVEVKAKIFVGNVVSPSIGGLITLPMEQEQLKQAIQDVHVGEEYIISDYSTNLPIDINEYDSPYKLNQFLHFLKKQKEEENLELFLTAFWQRDYNFEDTLRFLGKGNYLYFVNVNDTASLGEAVVRSGLLGTALMEVEDNITNEMNELKEKNVMDLKTVYQYLDFEKIGHDYECNGCRIHPTLNTAIMEVRQTNSMG